MVRHVSPSPTAFVSSRDDHAATPLDDSTGANQMCCLFSTWRIGFQQQGGATYVTAASLVGRPSFSTWRTRNDMTLFIRATMGYRQPSFESLQAILHVENDISSSLRRPIRPAVAFMYSVLCDSTAAFGGTRHLLSGDFEAESWLGPSRHAGFTTDQSSRGESRRFL